MTPMCINIDYSKGPITFFTDFNFNRFAIIMNQVIVIKEGRQDDIKEQIQALVDYETKGWLKLFSYD
jgi:hypothetical protein